MISLLGRRGLSSGLKFAYEVARTQPKGRWTLLNGLGEKPDAILHLGRKTIQAEVQVGSRSHTFNVYPYRADSGYILAKDLSDIL